jgi:hypothetical protein
MKKQEKGDLLEKLVLILERSTADNPSTKIFTKHKVKDRDGIKRELDVYCECETNGKLVKYAFECKNHKRGIELKDIDAFANKIDKLNITPFFVTTSHYQKGCIEKAAKLGITLCKLTKRLADKSELFGLTYYEKVFELDAYFPQCKGYPENAAAATLTTCEKCRSAVNEMVNSLVPALAPQLKNMLYSSHNGFKDQSIIPMMYGSKNAAIFKLKGDYKEPHVITHNQTETITIEGFLLHFKVWYEVFKDIPLNLEHFTYDEGSQPDKAKRFSYAEFLFKEAKMFISLTQVTGSNVFTIGEVSKPEAGERTTCDTKEQPGMITSPEVEFERITPVYISH